MSNPKTNVWTVAVKPWLFTIAGCVGILGIALLAMSGDRHPTAVQVEQTQAQPTETAWVTEWKDPQTPTVTIWTDTTTTETVRIYPGAVIP